MFCYSCGREILDGSIFCKYCGKEQPSASTVGTSSVQVNCPCDGCGFGDEEYWSLITTERKHCNDPKWIENPITYVTLQGKGCIEDTYTVPLDKDFLKACMVVGINSLDQYNVLAVTDHAVYAGRANKLRGVHIAMVVFFNAVFDTTKIKICSGGFPGTIVSKKEIQEGADEAFEAMKRFALEALEDDEDDAE